jgi:hypothetical protein
MTLNTMKKAAGAINTNGPHIDTNGANFRTDRAIEQAHDGKALATQIAQLANAGHTVHRLSESGYLVCKYGHTFEATDFAELQAFARRLGVTK